MDNHDQETQLQESTQQRAIKEITRPNREDRTAPITAIENLRIIVLYKVKGNKSTLSPEEDYFNISERFATQKNPRARRHPSASSSAL